MPSYFWCWLIIAAIIVLLFDALFVPKFRGKSFIWNNYNEEEEEEIEEFEERLKTIIKISNKQSKNNKNMKRFDLLQQAKTEEASKLSNTKLAAKEERNLRKELSDMKYNLAVKEEALQERLSSETEVTFAAINVDFVAIDKIKDNISSLEKFLKEYYGN